MEEAGRDQAVDPFARLEAGVKLDQGFRPEETFPQFPIDQFPDPGVLDLNEAGDEPGVIGDQLDTILEMKCVMLC